MKEKTGTSLWVSVLVQFYIAIGLLFLADGAFAYPTYEILESISKKGNCLDDITFSPTGTIYAVDSRKNQILVYGSDDQIDSRILIELPTAIAVGDSVLYVGSNKDFSVAILDLRGQVVGYLGRGAHEFKLPKNIAIDRETNDVYVVDQLDNSIKVYSSDGAFIRRIDDSPNLPQDVTIVGDEIFVLDQPIMTDNYGDQVRGARVSVYDMTGTLVRNFGTYGANNGEFVRPKAITSDSQGLIYIADAFNGSVLCFDQAGNFQRSILDPASLMIGCMGLAIDPTGRLLVSTPLSDRMNFFLIGPTL